jgi:isoleucyl-tRNA synthetase
MTKYREYKQLDLPAIGKEELLRWEKENTFEKSVTSRQGKPSFTFYEGPPSANGLPVFTTSCRVLSKTSSAGIKH